MTLLFACHVARQLITVQVFIRPSVYIHKWTQVSRQRTDSPLVQWFHLVSSRRKPASNKNKRGNDQWTNLRCFFAFPPGNDATYKLCRHHAPCWRWPFSRRSLNAIPGRWQQEGQPPPSNHVFKPLPSVNVASVADVSNRPFSMPRCLYYIETRNR